MSNPTPIRVLHLIKSLGRGGAEKLLPETAALHDKSRFEFHCIYFYHSAENLIDELIANGIAVHYFPSGNLGLFRQIPKVRAFIQAHDIDIIHSHLPWAGILSRLAGNKLHIPIVYTEHNTWDRYNKVSYWFNRMTFKQQDVAIAVSNEVALSMELNMLLNPMKRHSRLKVKNILNGVNKDTFRRDCTAGQAVREQFGIPQAAFVVGKVAVFRSQKRLWLWVEMALKILEQAPDVHFLLVGDGEWKDRLITQIAASGKSANFHLTGVQRQVVPFLSAMDLYMSSSEFEGLPIAMLEGMACGLPVVATRAGGIGEAVSHGREGYLCDVDQYHELSIHALKLIQNPTLQKQFAAAARFRIEQEFSMQVMVQQLEAVYVELFDKKQKKIKVGSH
jgi:L-malate glycosyltransferase